MARYTDEFRASAVLMLQAAGYPDEPGALSRVARELGVPHPTLSRWARAVSNPPPNEVVQRKKIDFIEAIENELAGIFQDMPDARQDADYRTLGTVAGILLDKKQLLEGKPTERTAVDATITNHYESMTDEQLRKIVDGD